MERNSTPLESDRTEQSTEALEQAIWERLFARYRKADAEVAEDWDDGSRMARSEYAGLMGDQS